MPNFLTQDIVSAFIKPFNSYTALLKLKNKKNLNDFPSGRIFKEMELSREWLQCLVIYIQPSCIF